MRRLAIVLIAGGAILVATLGFASHASAQNYVVNTLGDPAGAGCNAGAGFAGSLRQCILQANAAGGTNAISFSVTGKVTLTQGQIVIAGNALTITGPGARRLAIDGNANDRIFTINSGASLNLSAVTVQNGNPSGYFGAIDNEGGPISIDSSTFKHNFANGGVGAVYTRSANMTISNSTFVDNHATGVVGVMEFDGGTSNAITNVTITGNSGGQRAAVFASADVTVTNSTITNNTSGSGGGGTFRGTLVNTILAGNTPQNCEANPTDGGHNLDSGNGCGFTTGTPKFDLINTSPQLPSTVANNGGPTDTLALPATSPARDTGSSAACPTFDQRGSTRVVPGDATCDIGAYEFGAPVITGVNPASGSATCGTQVTLSGFRFTGANGVSFGPNPATNLVVASDTSATVTCPAGSGTVDVTATNTDGRSAVSAADQFTYAAAIPGLPQAGSGATRGVGLLWLWALPAILLVPVAGTAIGLRRRSYLRERQDS